MQRKTSRREIIEAHIPSILSEIVPPDSPLLQSAEEGSPEAIEELSIIEKDIRRALLWAAQKPLETQPGGELGIKLGELVPEGDLTDGELITTAIKLWELWLELNVPHPFRSSLLDGTKIKFKVETAYGDVTGLYDPTTGIFSVLKRAWRAFKKAFPDDERLGKGLAIYCGWLAAQKLMSGWREDLHDVLYMRWKVAEFETKGELNTFAATLGMAEGQSVGGSFRVEQQIAKRERAQHLGQLYQTLKNRKKERLEAKISAFDDACLSIYERAHNSCKQIYKQYRAKRKKFFGGKRETEKLRKEWQREWERIFEALDYDKSLGITFNYYDFFKKKPEEIAFDKVERLTGLSPTTLRTKLLPLMRQRRKDTSLDVND